MGSQIELACLVEKSNSNVTLQQNSAPVAPSPSAKPENSAKQIKNLATLEAWQLFSLEREAAELDAQQSLLGRTFNFLDGLFRNDGSSMREETVKKWTQERHLIATAKSLITETPNLNIREALKIIDADKTQTEGTRKLATFYLDVGDRTDEGLFIGHLIDWISQEGETDESTQILLDRAFQAEYQWGATAAPLAIYSLVEKIAKNPAYRSKAQEDRDALQGKSGFGRALAKTVFSEGVAGAAVDVGIVFASGGFANLAKITAKKGLLTLGVRGKSLERIVKGTGILAEAAAIKTLNTTQQVMLHDTDRITPEKSLKEFGATALMIWGVQEATAWTRSTAPGLAIFLNLMKAGESSIPRAAQWFFWGTEHAAGLSSTVLTTKASQTLTLLDEPIGGGWESLAHDTWAYSKFAGAHRILDHATQGHFSLAQQRRTFQQGLSDLNAIAPIAQPNPAQSFFFRSAMFFSGVEGAGSGSKFLYRTIHILGVPIEVRVPQGDPRSDAELIPLVQAHWKKTALTETAAGQAIRKVLNDNPALKAWVFSESPHLAPVISVQLEAPASISKPQESGTETGHRLPFRFFVLQALQDSLVPLTGPQILQIISDAVYGGKKLGSRYLKNLETLIEKGWIEKAGEALTLTRAGRATLKTRQKGAQSLFTPAAGEQFSSTPSALEIPDPAPQAPTAKPAAEPEAPRSSEGAQSEAETIASLKLSSRDLPVFQQLSPSAKSALYHLAKKLAPADRANISQFLRSPAVAVHRLGPQGILEMTELLRRNGVTGWERGFIPRGIDKKFLSDLDDSGRIDSLVEEYWFAVELAGKGYREIEMGAQYPLDRQAQTALEREFLDDHILPRLTNPHFDFDLQSGPIEVDITYRTLSGHKMLVEIKSSVIGTLRDPGSAKPALQAFHLGLLARQQHFHRIEYFFKADHVDSSLLHKIRNALTITGADFKFLLKNQESFDQIKISSYPPSEAAEPQPHGEGPSTLASPGQQDSADAPVAGRKSDKPTESRPAAANLEDPFSADIALIFDAWIPDLKLKNIKNWGEAREILHKHMRKVHIDAVAKTVRNALNESALAPEQRRGAEELLKPFDRLISHHISKTQLEALLEIAKLLLQPQAAPSATGQKNPPALANDPGRIKWILGEVSARLEEIQGIEAMIQEPEYQNALQDPHNEESKALKTWMENVGPNSMLPGQEWTPRQVAETLASTSSSEALQVRTQIAELIIAYEKLRQRLGL